MNPVTPNNFEELIASVGSSICERVRNLLFNLAKFVQLSHAYQWTELGTIADTFKADLCALGCLGGAGGGGTSNGLPVSTVTASDDTYPDKIAVSWTSVVGATGYDLYRSESNALSGATKIVSATTALSYQDTAVTPGTIYYYWIHAFDAAANTSDSTSDHGRASTLAVGTVRATDGTFATKIMVEWDAVDSATAYDLLRGITNVRSSASVIASALVALSFEDTDVVAGTTYYYWTRAYNTTQSTYSTSDSGYAGTLPEALSAVSDLQAGKGLSIDIGSVPPTIPLVWTPVAGAEAYDIYVGTVDNPAQAVRVRENAVPYNASRSTGYNGEAGKDRIYNNQTEILYLYTPPASALNVTYFRQYYFWVKAKRVSSNAASSPFSNSNAGALGWAAGDGTSGVKISGGVLGDLGVYTVPSGGVRLWLAIYGAGANGAGSGLAYGGGGGGGGCLIAGSYNVPAGAKVRLVHVPDAITARAASETSGANGPASAIEYSASGTWGDTIILCTCGATGGGQYNGAGGGLGGAGGVSASANVLSNTTVYEGRDGLPGVGSVGGMSGCVWGGARIAAAHFNNSLTWPGDGGAGSGADASLASAARTGGRGAFGTLLVISYAS